MISREELRQLASFECRGDGELAISFYFHPGVPRDKSHREEAILAKDLITDDEGFVKSLSREDVEYLFSCHLLKNLKIRPGIRMGHIQ